MSPSSRVIILLGLGGVVALTLIYYCDNAGLVLEDDHPEQQQKKQQQQVQVVHVVADVQSSSTRSISSKPAVLVNMALMDTISSSSSPIPLTSSPIPLAVPCLEKLKLFSPAFSCAAAASGTESSATRTTSKEDGNAVMTQQHVRANSDFTQFLTSKDRTGDLEACRARYRETQPGTPASMKFHLLQVLHLQKALREEQERTCSPTNATNADFLLVADHKAASTTILLGADGQNQCQVGIIFPRSLVSYCACAVWNDSSDDNRRRYMDNFFSGTMTLERQQSWMGKYAHRNDSTRIISDSTRRDYFRKTGLYDYKGYYDPLQSTRFALAPDGDFPWTYRFLEAIMCGAIPIVGPRNVPLDQEIGYTYCVASAADDRERHDDDDCDLYRNETARTLAAQANWLHFVQRHSFIGQQEYSIP